MNGDIADEESVKSGFLKAQERFGPVTTLIVNSAVENPTARSPIWELSFDEWKRIYQSTSQGLFLAIKHFLRSVHEYQQASNTELASPAIVVTETEAGFAAGNTGTHYGFLNSVREEIVHLNSEGRINSVAPGAVNSEHGPAPADVARTMAFLASKRAAGNISGQCIRVERGEKNPITNVTQRSKSMIQKEPAVSVPRSLPKPKRNKIRVAVSIDLDAVSGWLGTSKHYLGQV